MFGIKMPWTKRRERLAAEAAARREEETKRRVAYESKLFQAQQELLKKRSDANKQYPQFKKADSPLPQKSVPLVKPIERTASTEPVTSYGAPNWPWLDETIRKVEEHDLPKPFEGGGGAFDGAGASGDWTNDSSPAVDSSPSSSCDSSSGYSDGGGIESSGGTCD